MHNLLSDVKNTTKLFNEIGKARESGADGVKVSMQPVKTYTYNKLRERIIEIYGTQSKFAEKLGVSKKSVSKKMNCQTEFSQADIIQWSMLLNLQKDEYGEYFFA